MADPVPITDDHDTSSLTPLARPHLQQRPTPPIAAPMGYLSGRTEFRRWVDEFGGLEDSDPAERHGGSVRCSVLLAVPPEHAFGWRARLKAFIRPTEEVR